MYTYYHLFFYDPKKYLEQKILTHSLCIWWKGNSVLIQILQPGSLSSNHKVYHWFALNHQWVTSAHFFMCYNRMKDCTYFIGLLWGLSELIWIKHLEQSLSHNTFYLSVYYYASPCCHLPHLGITTWYYNMNVLCIL